MSIRLSRALACCALTFVLFYPSSAPAQHGRVRNKACEKAARIVSKGHPEKKELDAYDTLSGCGSIGANAFAEGISQYSTETDVNVLNGFMQRVDNWRDSTVMEAITVLALNNAASPQARVFAVRYLITRVHPFLVYSYMGLTAGDSTTTDDEGTTVTVKGCRAQISSDSGDLVATPLPADYVARVRRILTLLDSTPSTPRVVRNAARCAL